jgi:trimeric autotransporter adhesin
MEYYSPLSARRASRPGANKRLALGAWALLLVLGLLVLPVQPASAATFTVTKTADTNDGTCNADCSLREAIVAANASAGPRTITIPAGTYTLSIAGANENAAATGDLDILQSMTLNGAGSASTIIQAGASAGSGIDKVFSVNPNFDVALDVTFSGMTIRFGKNPSGYFGDGFGGGLDFEASGTGNLTLTDCIVTDNSTTDGDGGGLTATNTPGGSGQVTITNSTLANNHPARVGAGNSPVGGGIFFGINMKFSLTNTIITGNSVMGSGGQGQGGGIYYFGDATPAGSTIHGGAISNNQAPSDGGGIYTGDALTIDQGTLISGNSSDGNGGGLWNNATGTTTLNNVTVINNSATGAGGGIRNDGNASAILNVSFSRIVGNTAPTGSGVSKLAGTLTADDNWWGCNYGPGSTGAGCPVAPNTNTGATATRWLQLRHTASPATVLINGASSLAADVLGLSTGGSTAASNLTNLAAFPAPAGTIFSNPVLGTLSGASTQFVSGQAGATYTAGTTAGAGSADATADGQTVAASIAVTAPDLTVTKTHTGSFTQGQTGATYTIKVTNSGTAISSGTVSMVDTLPAGLTATALSGTNWSCVLGTLTCTCSDALGIGASYEDITLTVDVAPTAAPSVTNTATVSGGGEVNTGNNTANDLTTIVQAISETLCGFTAGNTYSFTMVNPVAIQIDAAGTLDCITVTRTDANHPNATPTIQTGRYWTISGAASGGGGATGFQVTLTLPQANLPNPRVCRHTGGGVWDCDDGTHTTSTTSTVTRSNISAFSDWAVGSNVPTAVSLAGFAARGDETPYAGVLLAGGILGLGGLWLARRRRQLVRVKVWGERAPETQA